MGKRVVIIGGGVAGVTAAEMLAKKGYRVTLMEREMHPAYSRVLLPHYLRGQIERERVFLKKESWYQEKGIEWMRGVEARRVDGANKFVETSEGREVPYDILVIAGGGEVRLREENLPEICYLRGIDDADTILAKTKEIKAMGRPSKALVMGSSFIAFEFVNYFHQVAGFETHVAMRGDGFWPKLVNDDLQTHVMNHVKEAGVHVHANEPECSIEGSEHVEGARLSNEIIEGISIVGAGIGIIPEVHLYAEMGVEVSNQGVHVNEFLETGVQDVYAIGDIAHYKDIHMNRHVTVGNWQNAMTQGRYVASRIEEEEKPFDLITSYATAVLGLEVTFIADTVIQEAEVIKTIEKDGALIQLFERDQKTVGAIIMGSAKERGILTNAIKAGERYGA